MEVKTKFSIGQVLRPRIDLTGKIKLWVVEITAHQCYAATQILYHCRIWTEKGGFRDSPAVTVHLLFQFTEPELEDWLEWEANNQKKDSGV